MSACHPACTDEVCNAPAHERCADRMIAALDCGHGDWNEDGVCATRECRLRRLASCHAKQGDRLQDLRAEIDRLNDEVEGHISRRTAAWGQGPAVAERNRALAIIEEHVAQWQISKDPAAYTVYHILTGIQAQIEDGGDE